MLPMGHHGSVLVYFDNVRECFGSCVRYYAELFRKSLVVINKMKKHKDLVP